MELLVRANTNRDMAVCRFDKTKYHETIKYLYQ